jgi:hypothetical protein
MHRWFSSSSCSTSWVVVDVLYYVSALLRLSAVLFVCFFNDFSPRFILVCFYFSLTYLFIYFIYLFYFFHFSFGCLNENNKTKQKMCCCLAQFLQRTCSARCPAACLSCRPHPSTRWRSAKSSDASRRPNASTPPSSAESFAGKKELILFFSSPPPSRSVFISIYSISFSTCPYVSSFFSFLLIALATTLKNEKK